MSFELVGYAPRSPRDWYSNVGGGRGAAEAAAAQLMDGSPLFQGVRKAATMPNQELVGISVWGPVVLVVWAGMPHRAFRWDRLERDPACQRYSVSVTPASHGMEARWEDSTGQIMRHVEISNGELVTNIGSGQLLEEGVLDPLADLRDGIDPDELAVQVVDAWFRISIDLERIGPPVYRYAWPTAPEVQGLAGAVRSIQADQAGFFALLATTTWDEVPQQVAERYGLDLHDVYALLDEPLLNLLPPTTRANNPAP